MGNAMGTVNPPPLYPPVVGLIASLGAPGGPYLDPPDGLAPFPLPPFNPEEQGFRLGEGGRRPEASPPQRWEGGVRYQPYNSCSTDTVADPCAPGTHTIDASPATVEAMPYIVRAGDKCSAFGWAEHNFMDRATTALLASESRQIARELWRGDRAQAAGWPNHYLANNAWADVLTNGPVEARLALSYLEEGLAQCSGGQRGVIHATRQLATEWSYLGNTFRSVNGLIMTYMGTIIIPDAGYDGSSPNGVAATSGHQWAYATLIPTVRRSEVLVLPDTFAEAMIRSTNDIEWRAERLAVATFDPCCHLAVEVDIPLALVGGAS